MITETVTAKYASTECSKYLVQNYFFLVLFFGAKLEEQNAYFDIIMGKI